MKKHILFLFTISFCIRSFAAWVNVGPEGGYTSQMIHHQNLIFVGSYSGVVFKSADQGQTWTACSPADEGNMVRVLTSDGTRVYAGHDNSGVFVSDDAGTSWQRLGSFVDSLTECWGIAINADTLIVAGSQQNIKNCVYRSIRSAGVWSAFESLTDGIVPGNYKSSVCVMNGLFYLNTGSGVKSWDGAQRLWVTTGAGWPFTATALFHYSDYYLATTSGSAYISADGINWRNIGLSTFYPMCVAGNGNQLVACTGGYNLPKFSLDTGATWATVTEEGPPFLNFYCLSAGNDVLVSGWGGGIYRISGSSGVMTSSNSGLRATPVREVVQTATGEMYVATRYSYIQHTGNMGLQWDYIDTLALSTNTSTALCNNNFLLFGFEVAGMIYSYTGGANFQVMNSAQLPVPIYDACVAGGDTLLISLSVDQLISPDNGFTFDTLGTHLWIEQFAKGTNTLYACNFTTAYMRTGSNKQWTTLSLPPYITYIYGIGTAGDDLLLATYQGFFRYHNGSCFQVGSGVTGTNPVFAAGSFDNLLYVGQQEKTWILDDAGNLVDSIPVSTNFRSSIQQLNSNLFITNNRGLWHFDSNNDIEPLTAAATTLNIYPNPANDFIHLICEEPFDNISIIEIGGRLVREYYIGGAYTHYTLGVDRLEPGIYLIQVNCTEGKKTARFVRQ